MLMFLFILTSFFARLVTCYKLDKSRTNFSYFVISAIYVCSSPQRFALTRCLVKRYSFVKNKYKMYRIYAH